MIVCEDIRDETGNKKSLMGVIGGDIYVPTFPATLRIAIYVEYVPDADDPNPISFEFRLLQDEVEIAKGRIETVARPPMTATLVLPSAYVGFEKEAVFSMNITATGKAEQTLFSKRISSGPVPSPS